MPRIVSRDGFEFLCVNPAIPHNSTYPLRIKCFQDLELLTLDALRKPEHRVMGRMYFFSKNGCLTLTWHGGRITLNPALI
jgi:hypothetical protein